jgi:hypothetical protein
MTRVQSQQEANFFQLIGVAVSVSVVSLRCIRLGMVSVIEELLEIIRKSESEKQWVKRGRSKNSLYTDNFHRSV